MPAAQQLHAVQQVNVYRAQVTFKDDIEAHEIAIIAASPDDAVNLIRGDLDDVVYVGAPTLAIAGVYLLTEDTPPAKQAQVHGHAHHDDAPRRPRK